MACEIRSAVMRDRDAGPISALGFDVGTNQYQRRASYGTIWYHVK